MHSSDYLNVNPGRSNPLKKDKIVLYMHAGSGNHGCEAIARMHVQYNFIFSTDYSFLG